VCTDHLSAIPIPARATPFPYTTLFRSKSDLRNLVTAEEAYFADSIKYTTAKACTNPAPAGSIAFCNTTGNTLGAITTGTGTQARSAENTSELQSRRDLVCRLVLASPAL